MGNLNQIKNLQFFGSLQNKNRFEFIKEIEGNRLINCC